MFIDLSEFIYRHSALIARAYELSGAAGWALIARAAAQLPVNRVGSPQGIADAIRFL